MTGKFGKDTKIFLYGVLAVCVLSFFAAFGLSCLLAKSFQKELVLHDYGVAGYLLNQGDTWSLSAFTAEKSQDDTERGSVELSSIGYSPATWAKLIPAVLSCRNQAVTYFFALLLFVFGTIWLLVVFYLRRQHQVIQSAENAVRAFLDGDTMSRIESGQPGEWYSLFHTINELSCILSAHAEKEKQIKEFLQGLIADISHQLKTPLSALKMYQEILESHSTDAAAVSSFSHKSLREIKRMEDVIYTFLKLAQLDAGMIQMQKNKENIRVLMHDTVERFALWAEREEKTITLSGKEDVWLFCDALWMCEAVGNIVKNALEHTKKGGRITVRWEQNPFITQIMVEDDGTGIHPQDRYQIFQRFYRSRFSQDTYGIGLGLPLAKTIVEVHGGTISVSGKPGEGTIFTLNFVAAHAD